MILELPLLIQADQRLGIDTTINGGTDIAVEMGVTQAIPPGTIISNTELVREQLRC